MVLYSIFRHKSIYMNMNVAWERTESQFEEQLNSLVDKEKTPGIDAILEVTYSKYPPLWDGKYFNQDLCQGFAGYTLDKKTWKIDFQELQDLFYWKMESVTGQFLELQEELQQSDYYAENTNKREVVSRAVEYNLKLLSLAKKGFVFELEKAWYEHDMSHEEVGERVKELEGLETNIFWGKILDNQNESELCFQYMNQKLSEYHKKSDVEKRNRIDSGKATRILSKSELGRLQGYMSKIETTLSSKWYNTHVPNVEDTETNATSEFLSEYGANMISREMYVDIFQKCIDLLWLPQKVRVTSVTSIYDGPKYLDIPDTDSYKKLSLSRIMKLISHEIMWHYVNQQVHEENFWKVRAAWNVEKEEWLAKFLDTVVLWWDVSWANAIVPNVSRILAWEILTSEEFEDFVDLYGEITEKKTDNIIGTILRHKRNYPLGYTGVQHKDVTYSRGLIKVVDFLKHGGSIHDLFQWKFSVEDIENNMTGNKDFCIWNNCSIFNPVLITDVILFYLITKTSEAKKFTHEWFVSYIQDKYGKYLQKNDVAQEQISQLPLRDLKKIFGIISPLLKNINWVEESTKKQVDRIL